MLLSPRFIPRKIECLGYINGYSGLFYVFLFIQNRVDRTHPIKKLRVIVVSGIQVILRIRDIDTRVKRLSL